MSINSIKEITGISHYHLTKLKRQLLKGQEVRPLQSLQPRRFEWTEEQVQWLTAPENLLSWGTSSLI